MGNVGHMEEIGNPYGRPTTFSRKPGGKRPIGRLSSKREKNTLMDVISVSY